MLKATAEVTKRANDAGVTQDQIRWARELVARALMKKAVPEGDDRLILAVLAGDLSYRQGIKAKAASEERLGNMALRRLNIIHILKRLPPSYRKAPQSNRTVQKIIGELEKAFAKLEFKVPISETTIRKDIHDIQANEFLRV